MTATQHFVTEKLTVEQADMTRRLTERILATVQQMAKETTKPETQRFAAEIGGKAEEAKMLALLSRVEGLSPPASGTTSTKRAMMDTLRRALDRLKLEEETDKEREVLNNNSNSPAPLRILVILLYILRDLINAS
ncbi:hypothetical protein DL764_005524 [Monosporascus ibericus]|uniref:Uncharacterized protein n=1 Tax=Monosporascus ibericus TaxID=155417 RepID=A0A4Q4T8Z9_9PEZI|nr:hypothetical protein DL764_005524 [Monosporascus ibericus]